MSRQFGNNYKNLIASGSNHKSEFNNNPGIEFGVYATKNPYSNLINKWEFTNVTPSLPITGRKMKEFTSYVDSDYVYNGYVEIQQVPN